MNNIELKLNSDELTSFRDWLELNLHSISWEGRNLDEFNQFWADLFSSGVDVSDYFHKFEMFKSHIKQGPVSSWFKWLEQKLLIYLFINNNLSVRDLSNVCGLEASTLSLILRDFFVSKKPHLELEISEKLQVSNALSVGNNMTFNQFSTLLGWDNDLAYAESEEIMRSLEITLYDDWKKLIDIFCRKPRNEVNKKILRDRTFLNRNFRFLKEILILFTLGIVFIFLIKVGNKAYEDYLVEKISLFSPKFFWLDKNVSFKPIVSSNEIKNIEGNRIINLEKLENRFNITDTVEANRYDVESDVVLTSIDSLPKDFNVADLEQSNYEEKRKGGYRDNRYGRRKAYRVMMTSVNPKIVKEKLKNMIKKFKVKQVDNVKPGTEIPGGIYFNLYVPRENLTSFLKSVSSVELKSTILESKTIFGGPKGMDKVFVWIKSI